MLALILPQLSCRCSCANSYVLQQVCCFCQRECQLAGTAGLPEHKPVRKGEAAAQPGHQGNTQGSIGSQQQFSQKRLGRNSRSARAEVSENIKSAAQPGLF